MNTKAKIRGSSGLLLEAVATLALGAVVLGATFITIVTSGERDTAGAIDRMLENRASAEDMDSLQRSRDDLEEKLKIGAAGAGLIGPSGPGVSAGNGTKILSEGASSIGDIIAGAIGEVNGRMAAPGKTVIPPSNSNYVRTGMSKEREQLLRQAVPLMADVEKFSNLVASSIASGLVGDRSDKVPPAEAARLKKSAEKFALIKAEYEARFGVFDKSVIEEIKSLSRR